MAHGRKAFKVGRPGRSILSKKALCRVGAAKGGLLATMATFMIVAGTVCHLSAIVLTWYFKLQTNGL